MRMLGAPARIGAVTPVLSPKAIGLKLVSASTKVWKIVDASDELISEPGRDDAVVDRLVVLHVRGHDLPVGTQMCAVRRRLCSLPEKNSKRHAVVFIEAVVEFEQAIMTVSI